MKKILLGLLFSASAHAQFNDTQRSFGVPNNALTNPGFEGGLAGWVKSGGNWSLSGSANAAEGKNALAMEFTAADQTLKSALTSIPRSVVAKYGGSCEASFVYLGGGGNTYEYYVENSSSTVVGGYTTSQTMFQITADASGDYVRPYTMTFLCDEDETYRIVIKNKTASTQTIYIDNASMGGNTNIGTVAQATLVGTITWAPAASCAWSGSVTSGTFANFAADTDCSTPTVTGAASAPGTKIPAIVFNNMPPGEYLFVGSGGFFDNSADSNGVAFRFSDGTLSTSGATVYAGTVTSFNTTVTGRVTVTSAGARTFNIQAAGDGATQTAQIFAANSTGLQINVYRFPTASETIARLDAPGVGWTAYTPSFTNFTAASSSFLWQCDSSTLKIIGTVTSTGAGSGSEARVGFPTNFISASGATVVVGHAARSTNAAAAYNVLAENGVSYLTFGAQASGNAGLTKLNGSQVFDAALTFSFFAEVPVTASSPCPKSPQVLIPGSVYSSSSGVERIERVNLAAPSGGSCAVSNESGDWINGTPTSGATGACTISFVTGQWSDSPVCSCTARPTTTGETFCRLVASPSTTSMGINVYNAAGAATNEPVSILCMGPR